MESVPIYSTFEITLVNDSTYQRSIKVEGIFDTGCEPGCIMDMATARHLNIHKSKKVQIRITFPLGNKTYSLMVDRTQLEFHDNTKKFQKYKCLIGLPLLKILDQKNIIVRIDGVVPNNTKISIPYCDPQLRVTDGQKSYSCFIDTGSPVQVDAINHPSMDLATLGKELHLEYKGNRLVQILSLGLSDSVDAKTPYDFILTQSIIQKLDDMGYICRTGPPAPPAVKPFRK